MVLRMHSVTVGMAAIVNPVRRDDLRGQYGWPNSHTGEVGFSTTGARPLTAGQYGWPNSSTRQHDTKPLWKLVRGTISTVHQQPHATDCEQAAPDEQRIWRWPATIGCHHVAGTGRKCCVVRTPRFIVACHPVTGSWKEGLCGTMGAFGARGRKGLFVSHCPARFARQPVRNWG